MKAFGYQALAAITGLALMSSATYAANGNLGRSSSAEVQLQAAVANLVRISRLDNLNLGEFDGSNDLSANDGFCVYRNGVANYVITATTSEGDFVLIDDNNELGYSVAISGTNISYASPLQLSNANTSSLSCNDSDNVNVEVSIASNDLLTVPAGAYAGTLTLTVAPE